MKQRLWICLVLAPVLWIAGQAAAVADGGAPVIVNGMTAWDLGFKLLNSVPSVLLTIAFCTWLMATVFMRIMEFTQPERVRVTALWKELDAKQGEIKTLERHVGYLILLVRELENVMEDCARTCPSCKGFVDRAIATAREKAKQRGLLNPEDDATLPGATV